MDKKDYTVGWICALPVELAASMEMLDEEYGDLPRDPTDSNSYALGRVGEHNVVVACLPAGQMGNNAATTVATRMQAKFTSIRFGLMVGIGGGVPSPESDIRLGDVVVSQPHTQHGGVIQYDFGKTGPGGFTRTGLLNAPPAVLLTALAKLKALHLRRRSKLSEYLSTFDSLPEFTYKSAGSDTLFESTYNHVSGPTCANCDSEESISRIPRDSTMPIAHYGTIASGNQVMKDGATRDRLSSELGGVLCFEMEAAGLMNDFPCLVIRGICDYADSHKNKQWQPYAAAVAAAYAKELLYTMPAEQVSRIRPAADKILESGEISW